MRNSNPDHRPKPLIIINSGPNDDSFDWLSGGWYTEELRGTAQGDELFARACEAIDKAENYTEAVRNLAAAGFRIEYRN
jgi:hypothetical protein